MARFKILHGIRVDNSRGVIRKGRITASGALFRIANDTFIVTECDCGSVNVSYASSVTRPKVQANSCGCIRLDIHRKRLKKHGEAPARNPSPEYSTLIRMIGRCRNPRNKAYKNYGGSGITISNEWTSDGGFERFLEHVGRRPSSKHSIDRIDNDRGYEPGNVKWSTDIEQARNRRGVFHVEINGRTMTIEEWSEVSTIKAVTIRSRLHKGWSNYDAVFAPIMSGRSGKQVKTNGSRNHVEIETVAVPRQ